MDRTRANPEKEAAKRIVNRALNRGDISRPTVCSACGQIPLKFRDGRAAIQAHHDDYGRPLDVRWLCVLCHSAEHRALKAEGESR